MIISENVRHHILDRLDQIEKEHGVKIILAVESGSRAWGFESKDSDYDVRFIYKHDLRHYVNVLPHRDVIEYPIVDEYDYSGWDIRKALFLLNKSNPVLFEWLNSPIIYKKDDGDFMTLKECSEHYFKSIPSVYHYLHMASGNWRHYLQGETVKLKKYFYVLRPIFACLWIEKTNSAPPMEFEKLLEFVDASPEFKTEVYRLLELKRKSGEIGEGNAVAVINDFIREKIEYFENAVLTHDPRLKPDSTLLDSALYKIVKKS
ncbi:nucleotidyltransferase domain-containing protein [Myxococcota bacterium]|nr:nucleotidyltransferase domain-containing protein [Myxococcota bacterium]MBU1383045.1 nucleotidyltransferase domain-containing protein [Myxococcota bacterium]